MADQDDGAPTTFAQGLKRGLTGGISSAAKGAQLATNTVANAVKSAFGLAAAPGEDNSNFPTPSN